MNPRVDTSCFQLGVLPDDEIEDIKAEAARLRADAAYARQFIECFKWAPPVTDVLLAFGPFSLLSLFLVRFSRPLKGGGEGHGDSELWVMVGREIPPIYFATDAETPGRALELGSLIIEDWADTVLAGEDTSECFPIYLEKTKGNAEGMKRLTAIIRKMIPDAGHPDNISSTPL